MTEHDRKPVAAILTGLAEVFNAELSATVHRLYFEALQDLSLDDLKAAARKALVTARYMPRPAELRELCGHGVESSELALERAWQAWKEAAKRHGAYSSVVFEDGAIGRAIQALWGSWPNACLAEHSPEMWASKRKEWSRAYPLYDHTPVHLPGLIEAGNRATRGTWKAGCIEPAQTVALVLQDGTVEARKLPMGTPPLSLVGPAALPAPEENPPSPEEAAIVLSRIKAHIAEQQKGGDAA